MKTKLAAYTAAAVLIGIAIMMLPLALETGPPTYDPRQAPSTYTTAESKGGNEQRDQFDNTSGQASQPSNMMPSGLMLLAGLVIALTAYILVKKQVNTPESSFSYKPF